MAAANNAPADPVVLAPPVQLEAPPSPPPRPAPKTGINRIAEMHALRYEPNEVTVNEEGSIEDYGEYAEGLLAVRLVCVLCNWFEFPHGTAFCLRPHVGRRDALHYRPLRVTRRRSPGAASRRASEAPATQTRYVALYPPSPKATHSYFRGERRRAARRAPPIRRVRRPAARSTPHQARRPARERIYAAVEPYRAPEQDLDARAAPAGRSAQDPTTAARGLPHAQDRARATAAAATRGFPAPSGATQVVVVVVGAEKPARPLDDIYFRDDPTPTAIDPAGGGMAR